MTHSRQKISFIINPISGTRKKESWPDIIRQVVNEELFDISVFFTERAGHGTELAYQQMKEGVPYIVAVGGDGTVNEVAMALRDSPSAMGIIPCGSGNGLARHLQIPLNLNQSLNLINSSKVVRIDYGIVNDKPFFCTFGTGFDAHIGNVFANSGKRGFSTYVKAIAREFISYRSKKYKIKIDGRKFKTRALLVTVANSAQFGNNAYISPDADIADGKLNVCVLHPFPKILAGYMALRLLRKNIHHSRYYHGIEGEEITIKRKYKSEVHLDGEPLIMGKKLKIKIIHHGLKVMVPQGFKA